MGKRQKRDTSASYLELGQLLRSWREKRFDSAFAMFREGRFSFAYSTYASFEAGQNLPSIEQLVELGKALGQELEDAMLTWARVQMPTPALAAIFRSRASGSRRAKQEVNVTELDNVWVLGQRELRHVESYPWLLDLFRALCTAHPKGVNFHAMDMHGLARAKFVRDCLNPLAETGNLIVEKNGARLLLPHLHVPNNDLGKRIRLGAMEATFEEMKRKLKSVDGARDILIQAHESRGFSESQAKRWEQRLTQLLEELDNLPFEAGTETEVRPHTMLLLFGKRN